jgi:hypothetical protein
MKGGIMKTKSKILKETIQTIDSNGNKIWIPNVKVKIIGKRKTVDIDDIIKKTIIYHIKEVKELIEKESV